MRFQTTSGNQYWYNLHTNEIETYEGQCDTLPYIRYLPVPSIDSLPDLEHFIIEVTQDCNFRCTYCCYSGHYKAHRTHQKISTPLSQIDTLYDFIERHRNKARHLTISFYGGEPFLQSSFLTTAVESGKLRFPADTDYTISTNGYLLSSEIMEWAIQQGILLHISLDGYPAQHDKYRRDLEGNPTFDTILSNLTMIKNRNLLYWYAKVRLFVTLQSYQDLRPIADYWQQNDLLSEKAPASIGLVTPNYSTDDKKDTEEDYESLLSLLAYYASNRNNLFCRAFFEGFTAEIQDRSIYEIPEQILPMVCVPHNYRCFIDAKGDIGVCEKISDRIRFGNIRKGINWQSVKSFVEEQAAIKQKRCTTCWAYRLCQTCYTHWGLSDKMRDQDCERTKSLIQWKLQITLEMAERGLLAADETPFLSTSHCQIHAIEDKDLIAFKFLFEDEQTQRFLPDLYQTVKDDRQLWQFVTDYRYYSFKGKGFLWGIYHKYQFIGFVAVMDLDFVPQISYAMHPMYRNRGFMQESVSMITHYLCTSQHCLQLQATVDTENSASQKVLEQCGYCWGKCRNDKVIFEHNSKTEE